MKIEEGKFYRLHDGRKARIYEIYGEQRVIHGVIYEPDETLTLAKWNLSGSAPGLGLEYYIKEEWREKHPAEDWPRGKVIEVSINGSVWSLRRFREYRKGAYLPIVTLNDVGTDVAYWRFGRVLNEN